jgi:hypothetical protein
MPDETQIVTIEEKNKNRQKRFTLSFGIVVAILFILGITVSSWKAGLSSLLQSAQTPVSHVLTQAAMAGATLDWNTYAAKTGTYTAKYPKDWKTVEASDSADMVSFTPSTPDQSDYVVTTTYGTFVFNPIQISEEPGFSTAITLQNSKVSTIVVNGMNATSETGDFTENDIPGTRQVTKVILMKNTKTVTILLYNQRYSDVFQQLLSTIQVN